MVVKIGLLSGGSAVDSRPLLVYERWTLQRREKKGEKKVAPGEGAGSKVVGLT